MVHVHSGDVPQLHKLFHHGSGMEKSTVASCSLLYYAAVWRAGQHPLEHAPGAPQGGTGGGGCDSEMHPGAFCQPRLTLVVNCTNMELDMK